VGATKCVARARDSDGGGGGGAAGGADDLLCPRDCGADFDADEEPVPLADAGGDGGGNGAAAAGGAETAGLSQEARIWVKRYHGAEVKIKGQ
jgi:hypothetical protein